MFRAKIESETIDLIRQQDTDLRLLEEIKNSRAKRIQLKCTACNEPIHLRYGDIRIPHFAHIDRQAKDCPYLSFPAGFHKRAQALTMFIADYVTKTYPDAQCDAEVYFNDYEIFFHLQVRFSQGQVLVFRFRRKNPEEKEWREVPATEVIPGAKTIFIIVGNPDKNRFTAEMYRDLVDPSSSEIPPFIYFSNSNMHIMDWQTRIVYDFSPDKFAFTPDGQVYVIPEPSRSLYEPSEETRISAKSDNDDDLEDNDDENDEDDDSIDFDSLPGNDEQDQNQVWISDDQLSRLYQSQYSKYQQSMQTDSPSQNFEPHITTEAIPTKANHPVSGKYLCGHAGNFSVYCFESDIDAETRKLFDRVCPACSAGTNYDEDKAILDRLMNGPPKLYGSNKQIDWVKRIQQEKLYNPIRIDCGCTQLSDIVDYIQEMHASFTRMESLRWYLAFAHILVEKTSVQWWIDHRDDPINAYLKETNQLPTRLI
ncbi:MAG: competence protein CoiA family protein [Clostridiaceae bacterium]|nr:competence protein CoiA family protein [Clostridiaceae bacterium]